MSNSTKLLDHLIKVKNLSGAIKPAPWALKNLKQEINGVPFQLLQPGMSGVLQKALQGIQQLIQQLGSMSAVGNFNGNAMKQTNSGQINNSDLNNAVGDATMLTAGLITFGGGFSSNNASNNASSNSQSNTA